MTREEVEAKVKRIIAEQVLRWWRDEDLEDLHEEMGIKIVDNAHIVKDLGADSITKAELTMELEEEFDIGIAEDEAQKIRTVSDCVEAVWEKLKSK